MRWDGTFNHRSTPSTARDMADKAVRWRKNRTPRFCASEMAKKKKIRGRSHQRVRGNNLTFSVPDVPTLHLRYLWISPAEDCPAATQFRAPYNINVAPDLAQYYSAVVRLRQQPSLLSLSSLSSRPSSSSFPASVAGVGIVSDQRNDRTHGLLTSPSLTGETRSPRKGD